MVLAWISGAWCVVCVVLYVVAALHAPVDDEELGE